MAYIEPSEFVTKMVDSGEQKVFMSTKDTFIRAYMAGAILGLAAVFAITVAVKTGSLLVGSVLFPVGFHYAVPDEIRLADWRVYTCTLGVSR